MSEGQVSKAGGGDVWDPCGPRASSLAVRGSTDGYRLVSVTRCSSTTSASERTLVNERTIAGPFLREIDAWNAMFDRSPGVRPRGLVQDCHP